MINLEELEQFKAFAECGTLSKVAERFHISTPSITRSMQNIESYFGVPLFTRTKNRIELNETGKVAVEYAGKILNETAQALAQVRAFDERQRTVIIKSCAPAPLWEFLKKAGSMYPGMTVSSKICRNEEVLEYMKDSACDYAILPYEAAIPGWQSEFYMEERLYVCIPADNELAERQQVEWEQLNGFNFLLRSELGFWDALCREKMPASKFLVQTDDSVFDELVVNSTLPCFTTDYIADRDGRYPKRVCVPIAGEDADVKFYLYRKNNT
ncbi:MAG: LysR family transcriptional regulator [Lachnospiraceae bacterium]|nr:LysR family transcriptional regulator [Lachnospiraceae bacterium]